MTSPTRSGRPHAGCAPSPLRAISRQSTIRTTTTHNAAAANTKPTAHPARRDHPSWEELFGRR